MKSKKHIVVFSHGFGVRKDDRGLFLDIASALKNVRPILFDYNKIDEIKNTIFVCPFSDQTEILKNILKDINKSEPNATIDLICHSQGSIAAGLLSPKDIRKIILLSPPENMDLERMLATFKDRPGTEIDMMSISKLARRDGSITLVPNEYWNERKNVQPAELYNKLALNAELIIIKAKQDEVLGKTDFSKISKAKIIELDANHDFTGETRKQLIATLTEYILK